MFKQSISNTALTSNAANTFFPNINGESFGSDNTFLATLRALVAPRLPEGERVSVAFGFSDFPASVVGETPADRMVEMICSSWYPGSGQIYIHNVGNRTQENNLASFELLKSKFCEIYTGFHRLEKVTDFYHKSFNVICFINPEHKSTVLFVESLDVRKLHYLQCAILAILPWYFNPADGISEDELALINSLRERTPANYEACIEKIASRYDFESGRIKELLKGFEIRYEKLEVDRVKRSISNIDNNIEALNRQFADYHKQRVDACIRLLGLETKIAQGEAGESEIMEYFLRNRRLYLEAVNNSELYFCVKDYLTYFDEEAAKKYITNNRSYLYDCCGTGSGQIKKEQLEKLLRAVFLDEVLKIKFCAAYKFNLTGSVQAQTNYHFPDFGTIFAEFMPNPHIDRYRCMGNYETKINNLLKNRDYIGALEQCAASAKSLNFHDSTVMSEFVRQICTNAGKNNRCIELPDGKVVKPAEAIKWIEAQEVERAKKEEEKVQSVSTPADDAVVEVPF